MESLSSTCPIVVWGESTTSCPSSQVMSVHGKVKVGELHRQGDEGEFNHLVELYRQRQDRGGRKSLEVKLDPADGKLQVVFGECVSCSATCQGGGGELGQEAPSRPAIANGPGAPHPRCWTSARVLRLMAELNRRYSSSKSCYRPTSGPRSLVSLVRAPRRARFGAAGLWRRRLWRLPGFGVNRVDGDSLLRLPSRPWGLEGMLV